MLKRKTMKISNCKRNGGRAHARLMSCRMHSRYRKQSTRQIGVVGYMMRNPEDRNTQKEGFSYLQRLKTAQPFRIRKKKTKNKE